VPLRTMAVIASEITTAIATRIRMTALLADADRTLGEGMAGLHAFYWPLLLIAERASVHRGVGTRSLTRRPEKAACPWGKRPTLNVDV
jgi:hypothetical protein